MSKEKLKILNRKKLKEGISGGAIGAGAIANNRGGGNRFFDGKMVSRIHSGELKHIETVLKDFYDRVGNAYRFKEITTPFKKTIKEGFEIEDIVSKLKDVENKSRFGEKDTVTYGVEDDDGNVMKITVPSNESDDFERHLATEMADYFDKVEILGGKANAEKSLAEILYNMRSKFNILDVEFPTIPRNMVYNADKASASYDSEGEFDDDVEEQESDQDMGSDVDEDLPDNIEDLDGEEAGSDEDEVEDDDSVSPFPEDEQDDESGMLKSILDMLKAEAEARMADAEARAEEARALQAEYTAKAAKATVEQEEELQRMEIEMEKKKKQEKEAKKLADLAKFRAKNAASSSISESFLVHAIKEMESFETPDSLRRQKNIIRRELQPKPGDSPEQRKAKRLELQSKMREIDMRIRRLSTREQILGDEEKNNDQDENSDDNQQQSKFRQPTQPQSGSQQ